MADLKMLSDPFENVNFWQYFWKTTV